MQYEKTRTKFNETLVFQGPVTVNEPGKTEHWIEIRRHIFYHRIQGVKYFKKVGNVKCQILKMVTNYRAPKSEMGAWTEETLNGHYCFKNYGLKERKNFHLIFPFKYRRQKHFCPSNYSFGQSGRVQR